MVLRLARAAAAVLIAVATLLAAPAAAEVALRILVFDADLFRARDEAAFASALADVETIESRDRSRALWAIVFDGPRSGPRPIVAARPEDIGAAIRKLADFAPRTPATQSTIQINQLSTRVDEILDRVRVPVPAPGADRPVVDLRIFAERFHFDRTGGGKNQLTEWSWPDDCVAAYTARSERWPDHLRVQVEFRPPAGSAEPPPGAHTAVIIAVTGLSRPTPDEVSYFGWAGPRCETGAARDIFRTVAVDENDLVCEKEAKEIDRNPNRVTACRNIPPFEVDPVARDFAARPVHARLRDGQPGLDALRIGPFSLPGFDAAVSVGPVTANLTGPPPDLRALPRGSAELALRLEPSAACRPAPILNATFEALARSAVGETIRFVAAGPACVAMIVPLGRVILQ